MNNDVIKLFPSSFHGNVTPPSSKSVSHRAIICASLAKGKSTIDNVIYSEDMNATIDAMTLLGAKITKHTNKLTIQGIKKFASIKEDVFCNESGSTLRFLIPLFTLVKDSVTFSGKSSLMKRPLTIYEEIFKKDDISFIKEKNKITVNGSIKARKYTIDGSISSQFFTGLMFALPLLKEDSEIKIKNTLESKSYIDITIEVLKSFGVEIDTITNGYYIKGNQTYSPQNYTVETDFSQAAFFMVGAALSGDLVFNNLALESKQGDAGIIDVLKSMKAKTIFMENGFNIIKSRLHSTIVSLENCPDLGPIIALAASQAKGSSKIKEISRLRMKESDRVLSTMNTLTALGVTISEENDILTIKGSQGLKGNIILDSYNDHRIAMMIAIAALVANGPITLTNASAVNKSYPHFFEDYVSIGGKFEVLE